MPYFNQYRINQSQLKKVLIAKREMTDEFYEITTPKDIKTIQPPIRIGFGEWFKFIKNRK